MTTLIQRKRSSFAQITRSIAEGLESRLFLSISSSILAGPELIAGNVATYSYNTVSGTNTVDSGTYTVTAVGDKNFGGQAAFESDDTTTPKSGGTTIKKTYLAQTSQGLIDYGDNTLVDGSTTIINNYSPPSVVFPATAVAGVTYTMVSTGTQTNSDNAGSPPLSIENTVTATLSSDSTTPITVPLGTYDCYVITGSTHNVDDITQPNQSIDYTQTYYIAAGVGLVKEVVVFAPDAQGGGGSTTTYQLTSFDDAERLVIQKPVPNVAAGDPISPAITVAVEDSSGNVVTDSDATTVTLNIAGVNAGNPIAGNTASIVNGIATFSNVVLSKAASYQLQPSDDVNDPGVISNKFTVGGDTLAFLVQPKSSDVDQPLILKVKALTQKGKVDTALTDTLQLGLNIVSGGAGAVLGGTTAVAFKGGIASFTTAAGVVLNTPGNYTLSATAISAGASDQSITGITSDAFAISGYHLVFTKPPGTVDVFDPVPLTVSLETAHGKVDKLENSAQVQLTLTTLVDGQGAVLSGTTVATFKAGIATFPAAAAPTINGGGTFTLTATEIGATDPAAPMASRKFAVLPDILREDTEITSPLYLATRGEQVIRVSGGYDGQYAVAIYTAQGKQLPNDSKWASLLPDLQITAIPISKGATIDHFYDTFAPFYAHFEATSSEGGTVLSSIVFPTILFLSNFQEAIECS